MSQINFRGKAVINTFSINKKAKIRIGDWVYGAVIPFDDGIDLIYERDPNNPEICGCHGIDVDHKTIGQFTGLYDKNGKEIYEGDIFKINELDGVISWHPNGYWCLHTSKDDVSENSYTSLGEVIEYAIREKYDYEVIGNIHDTKTEEEE